MRRCLRCALSYLPLVRRSALVSLLVGTVLVAINQGNVIVQGDATLALAWKAPLTYAVPYCVATFGAIMNARTRVSQQGITEPAASSSWKGGEKAADSSTQPGTAPH